MGATFLPTQSCDGSNLHKSSKGIYGGYKDNSVGFILNSLGRNDMFMGQEGKIDLGFFFIDQKNELP